MVVHDEESLEEALALVEQGPVRYSDRFAWVGISSRNTLESISRAALKRGDIAIVASVGEPMEEYAKELTKVLARRKRQEQMDMREYFREHPERVEKVAKKFGEE